MLTVKNGHLWPTAPYNIQYIPQYIMNKALRFIGFFKILIQTKEKMLFSRFWIFLFIVFFLVFRTKKK